MKLKTLKDLGIIDHQGRKGYSWQCIDIEELKKEAIKWVKWFNKKMMFEAAHNFQHFFNITEEDLK